MESLADALAAIERRRQTLEVFSSDDTIHRELATQFDTRNVAVVKRPLPRTREAGFVVIRDAMGAFAGALGIDHLQALLSPEVIPPWQLDGEPNDMTATFDFLANTVFTASNRRQLLAVSREIEERAWRTNHGHLYVGFQRPEAVAANRATYRRFARERSVSIRLFFHGDAAAAPSFPASVDCWLGPGRAHELVDHWFVLFDGGGEPSAACGLLAAEREPGQYAGFWTNEFDRVDPLLSYLESTYPRSCA